MKKLTGPNSKTDPGVSPAETEFQLTKPQFPKMLHKRPLVLKRQKWQTIRKTMNLAKKSKNGLKVNNNKLLKKKLKKEKKQQNVRSSKEYKSIL